MIIELYGPPGGGKSTWARTVTEEQKIPLIRIRSKGELCGYALLYFLQYPINTVVLLWYIFRFGSSPYLWYSKFMNIFLGYGAKWMKARMYKETCIIDQGHHQAVISLFEHPVSDAVIARLLAHIPMPDRLLVFDMPAEIRAQRVFERAAPDIRSALSEEAREAWRQAFEVNHRTAAVLLRERPNVRFVTDDRTFAEAMRISQ